MLRPLFAGLIPIVLAICGCQSASTPSAPPITPSQFPAIRAEYQRANPQSRVGLVTAVVPGSDLAAVGYVQTTDFSVGDVVTFLDSREQPLTMGTVVQIEPGSLELRYQPPAKGSRAPAVGDMAVRAIP